MKTIIVTGTPCTGKTALAEMLCNNLNFHYVDVNKTIKKYKIKYGYDKKRKCKIIDVCELNKALLKEIIKAKNLRPECKFFGIIIDSHLSHYLPKKYVDLCIVTKCRLKTLRRRLQNRGYGKNKIRENIDAEIFDICRIEAMEKGHSVLVVNTDKKVNCDNLIRNLYKPK